MFAGRVTQESQAKNFQIECKRETVLGFTVVGLYIFSKTFKKPFLISTIGNY